MRRKKARTDAAAARSIGLLILVSFLLIIVGGVGFYIYEFAVSFLG
jgi:hypothetical protein